MDTAVQTGVRDGSSDRERIVAGVIDIALITGLVLFGRVSHGADPIAEPLASLEAVTPFVVGWLAIAALAGVYTHDRSGLGNRLRLTTVAWIAAANVGLMLRASSLFSGSASWPFPLVITGTGLFALLGWRLLFVLVARLVGR